MSSVETSLPLHEPSRSFIEVLASARRLVEKTALVALLLALWEIVPRLGVVDATFLPPLSEVAKTGLLLIRNGQLATHVGASLLRAGAGFGLGIVVAIPLGLFMARSAALERMLAPLIEAARNTAPLALLPVFILLLGIGETSKITIVAYAAFFPILLNTIGGVRNVDPLLIKSARTMGLSPTGLMRKVILPAAVPTIFVGIRIAGALSLLVLIAAEMIGAKAGLGFLIIYSQYNFQIPHMFVGILTTTVVGMLVNHFLLYVERRFTAWRPAAGQE